MGGNVGTQETRILEGRCNEVCGKSAALTERLIGLHYRLTGGPCPIDTGDRSERDPSILGTVVEINTALNDALETMDAIETHV